MTVARLTEEDFEKLSKRMEALPGESQPQKVLRIHQEFPGNLITSYMFYKMTDGKYDQKTVDIIPGASEDMKTIVPRKYIERTNLKKAPAEEYMRRAAGEREEDPIEIQPNPEIPNSFCPKNR